MNRERNGKLLTGEGFAVLTRRKNSAKCLKRPDGGVVTQRTANPNTSAVFRQFLPSKIANSVRGFPKAFVPIANSAPAIRSMKDTAVDNLETRVAKAISRAMTVTYNGKEQAVPQFTQRAAQAAIAAVREWDKERHPLPHNLDCAVHSTGTCDCGVYER